MLIVKVLIDAWLKIVIGDEFVVKVSGYRPEISFKLIPVSPLIEDVPFSTSDSKNEIDPLLAVRLPLKLTPLLNVTFPVFANIVPETVLVPLKIRPVPSVVIVPELEKELFTVMLLVLEVITELLEKIEGAFNVILFSAEIF